MGQGGTFPSFLVKAMLLCCWVSFCSATWALPEQCLQSRVRDGICPHLIYKKSPVDIPRFNIQAGQVACLCLADVDGIRLASEQTLSTPHMQVTLRRLADDWHLSKQDILLLLRE